MQKESSKLPFPYILPSSAGLFFVVQGSSYFFFAGKCFAVWIVVSFMFVFYPNDSDVTNDAVTYSTGI